MCATGRWVVMVGPKVIGTMGQGGCFGRALSHVWLRGRSRQRADSCEAWLSEIGEGCSVLIDVLRGDLG